MRHSRAFIVVVAAVSVAVFGQLPAQARNHANLRARPAAVPLTLSQGASRLTDHAIVYLPARVTEPTPLIVLLHGAGGNAATFLQRFTAQADKRGAILLAVQSAKRTWGLRPGQESVAGGPDPENVDAALTALFAQASIDEKRVIVAGFSDGATYALWLGRGNAQLFRGILAVSPGFLVEPSDVDSRQRIFIAHGRRDGVIPFTYVRNSIVPQLERAGYRPRTAWFIGGHTIDQRALNEGLDYLLAK